MKKESTKFFLVAIILLFSFLSLVKQSPVIFIDTGVRELFIDHFLIDTLLNTELVLHSPRDEGPVLFFDKPWEGPFSAYVTVIRDDSLFRLYYRGLPEARADGTIKETTCYAESIDGIRWSKPSLKLFTIDGSIENNVILAVDAPFSHNFSPFLDTNPNALKNEKFKALAGTSNTGLFMFYSHDGIHWKKEDKAPVFTKGIFDSQNVAFWSAREERYLCYFRSWTGDGYSGVRTVSRTTSADFHHWSDPEKMTFGGTPMEHLYTNQTHAYFRAPQIYIALAARFMPNRQVLTEEEALKVNANPDYFKDCSDVVLLTSRGGNEYDRTFMESYIRPGIGLQNWVSRSNYPALNVVQTGPSEMSLYVNQNYAQPTAHLRRYSLRVDGFSSLQAGYKGGEMVTKVLTFKGEELFINFATSAAGEIKIGIENESGVPYQGFSVDECQTIVGNEIEKKVKWHSGESLKKLSGKPVRLRFVLKDADIYSFIFKNTTHNPR
ncbi:MAG: hypothetical protein OEY51_12895 [Cyclobacteriaceae bacterium]|nr:hypothetical protein [Cyclobacteriaceae bacterium]